MRTIEQIEAWARAGRHQEAFDAAGEALAVDPDLARALIVRANTANALDRREALIDALERLLRLYPSHPAFRRPLATAINNRGSQLRGAGDSAAAVRDFRRAIDLDPAHAHAWFNLGLATYDLGQREAAVEAFSRHLELQPEDRVAQMLRASLQTPEAARRFVDGLDPDARQPLDAGWLALTASRAGRLDAAAQALDRLAPTHDQGAALEAISELRLRGAAEVARRGAERVVSVARTGKQPSLRAELVAALALPAIYAHVDDIEPWRMRFEQGLGRLEADWTPARLARLQAPLRQLSHSNFLLAYQGHNDLALQTRFAALIEGAAAALQPGLRDASQGPARPGGRIGLLSSCWRNCTVGSYFGSWIGWLRAAGHHVHLYQIGPQRDAHTERLATQATRFRYFEDSIENIAQAVRADGLDLLIYPEIGMDARLTPLAALRLARHQAVAWGHPVTSGFSTLDHFLSCAEMEPADGALHYRETLTGLPGLGVDYLRPAVPAPAAAARLDPSCPRVLVPQSLFKLHPEGDRVMAAIARALPRVQFALFEPEYAEWKDAYLRRLEHAFAEVGRRVADHVVFHPLGTREQYLQVNLACDLMLDSLHWSGGNTAIDALTAALPLVACPGALMRGRQSAAMLRRLGLEAELVCATPEAQAARAVELLTDPAARRELSDAIRTRLPQLFDATPARDALLAWVAGRLAG